MIKVRKAGERGHADHGWLDTFHTFSFADYHDPEHVHFRGLRVINEDYVAPGRGFGKHPHRDMEILTWILEGSLQHEDSMGNGSVIRPGEAQVMSAGTGVMHSEFNPSPDTTVHLLQIWIFPRRKDLPPRYEQASLADRPAGALHAIAGPRGSGAAVVLEADATVYVAKLELGAAVRHQPAPSRGVWVQVSRGEVSVNDVALSAGDGVALEGENVVDVVGRASGSEVLLFDLA
ncbi:MAG: pirin family protein [Planctomycetota bacterium]